VNPKLNQGALEISTTIFRRRGKNKPKGAHHSYVKERLTCEYEAFYDKSHLSSRGNRNHCLKGHKQSVMFPLCSDAHLLFLCILGTHLCMEKQVEDVLSV
jgi:hypothetical protein